ncbi:HNH endonuclease [bacterium]|nr:HNH endonuclease [bacterium]
MAIFYQKVEGDEMTKNLRKSVLEEDGIQFRSFMPDDPVFNVQDNKSDDDSIGLRRELSLAIIKRFQLWGGTNKQSGYISRTQPDDFLLLYEDLTTTNVICGRILHNYVYSSAISEKVWGKPDWPSIIILDCHRLNLTWDKICIGLGYKGPTDHHKKFRKYNSAKWSQSKWSSADEWITTLIEDSQVKSEEKAPLQPQHSVGASSEGTWPETDCPSGKTPRIVWKVDVEEQFSRLEGNTKRVTIYLHERDPKIVKLVKARAEREGMLRCAVCGMSFSEEYGEELGSGFIEAHHITPIGTGEVRETSIKDIALLCSNCHRMIHRGDKILTVKELIDIREKAKNRSGNEHS